MYKLEKYYVNNNVQPNGDHEVHVPGCQYLSLAFNSTYLGEFADCKAALKAAEKHRTQVNGCRICCGKCHR